MKMVEVEGEVAGAKHMQLVPPACCLCCLNLREEGREEGRTGLCLPAWSSLLPLRRRPTNFGHAASQVCAGGVWPQSTGLPLAWKTCGLNGIGLPWGGNYFKS